MLRLLSLSLYMERTKVSEVFVNDSLVGMQNSLSTPHVYLIKTAFHPGINRIKIIINYDKGLLPVGGTHAWADDVQTNWNGILGDFHLRRLDDLDIRNIRIDASSSGKCDQRLELLNTASTDLKDRQLTILVKDTLENVVTKKQTQVNAAPGNTWVDVDFEMENPVF